MFSKFKAFIAGLFVVSLVSSAYPTAYNTSLQAYNYAYTHGYTSSKTWIYVDFTLPCTQKRLFVVRDNKVIYSTYVTHGINSGKGIYATSFSNVNGSLQSSLGVIKVEEYFNGKHGRSGRLIGLEQGYNNNIRNRAIIIHAANYIGQNGQLTGHSWGCYAVNDADIKTVLDYATPGTILISYYPDSSWLANSQFLK